MKTLIKNGVAVTGSESRREDILIEDGKIISRAQDINSGADTVLDAEGCYVFPGFIDAHTHLEMEGATGTTADSFPSGSRAAIVGGTTTIIDFATQDHGKTLDDAMKLWLRRASGRSACDYGFHMAITDWTRDMPEQMAEMSKRGVTSFKVYFAYDNLRISDDEIKKALDAAARIGAVMCAHCEDGDMVNAGVAREKGLGHFTTDAHPRTRPNEVEALSVRKFLKLAKDAGAEPYVVHLSTAEGLDEIRAARRSGQTVYAETCPQYLMLTDEVYSLPDFAGERFVCSPPLRKERDRLALLEAVRSGEIDAVSTDHCSFTIAQKAVGRGDFSMVPNGLPGIEHRPLVMFGFENIGAQRLVGALSENPAKIFGMYPKKGSLNIGADADIVVWDPNAPVTINAASQYQTTDYTPYEGMKVSGSPRYVLLRGTVAAERGRFVGDYCGEFVKRN